MRYCYSITVTGSTGCYCYDPSFDLVKSAASLLALLRDLPPTTPIGTFTAVDNTLQCVAAADIQSAIQLAAIHDNLPAHRYTLTRIGTHSICSGGTMHLKLAGYDNDIIQKLGHWSSNTYLTYIQTQISQLITSVAQRMASINLQFHQVG
jgi:hypothetical protein